MKALWTCHYGLATLEFTTDSARVLAEIASAFHTALERHSVEVMGEYEHILLKREKGTVTITMNRASRRNSLAADHLAELLAAFRETGKTDASGIVLAAAGPVFCAGHDFGDVAARDLAGCQLVASCDLAVAGRSAGFALPGGKGGWFCHTPAVPVARTVGRKRLMELALTGDVIDAATALDWGLVNRVVPDDELDDAVAELLGRATQGSRASKALGKQTLYAQLDRPETDAYTIALEVMAAASQTPAAREGMAAFLQKRKPDWRD